MCNCGDKYITNRYVNRGCDDSGYITIWDNLKKEEFSIEAIGPNSFANNGYDEYYYCTKCKESWWMF